MKKGGEMDLTPITKLEAAKEWLNSYKFLLEKGKASSKNTGSTPEKEILKNE
jgi:hypothetical protein